MSNLANKLREPTFEPYVSHLDKLQLTVSFDAIIVPQGRPAEHIFEAATLAQKIGTTLISLCSREAKMEEVANYLSNMDNAPEKWIAVDVPQGYTIPDVDLVAHEKIPEIGRQPEDWDLSTKRDIALLIAKLTDSERIFMMDDDISVSLKTLIITGLALHVKDIAGPLCDGDFQDNSSYMHAKAALESYGATLRVRYGGRSARSARDHITSVRTGMLSGNSMGINARNVDEHFPTDYNEDWYMMYKSVLRNQLSVVPAKSHQLHYDPFVLERARQQEFGDIVAPGLYTALDIHGSTAQFEIRKAEYWDRVIDYRRGDAQAMIEAADDEFDIKHRPDLILPGSPKETIIKLPPEEAELIKGILEAGLEVSAQMDGEAVVDYIHELHADQKRWEAMILKLPKRKTPEKALSHLALDSYISSE